VSTYRLSHLRVGRRLGLAFGAVGALVLVSTGVGLSAVAEQRDIAEDLSATEGVLQEAESARFQIADVSGWQGLVMADVAAFGPAAGLAPDAYNRAGMLESKDAVYAWMDGVDTSAMDEDEKSAWAELEPAWDNYFAMDDQVVAWVSDGSAAGFRTAVESINGAAAGEGYGIILDIADRLEASADARGAVAPRPDAGPGARDRAARRGRDPGRRPVRGPRDARRPLGRPAAAPGEDLPGRGRPR
jgi:methyl-accepting chemotaxis protein